MADITFYKYLEAAFRFRLLNPEGKKATLKTHFNYLGYNLPFERIFHYARKVLPSLYTLQFPNTEEGNLRMAKKVLDALDRKLDTQLEKYFDPTKAPAEYQQLIDEAQSESRQAEVSGQTSGGEAAATMGMPGLPSAPSVRSTPRITRIIQNVPQTPEPPKPEIVVANSSGIVREAGDPSKLVATNSSGVIKEAGDPSKLVKTTRSGEIVEAGQPSKLVKTSGGRVVEPGQPSKLVTTGSSGAIKEKPPSKIYIPQNRSGVPAGERPITPSPASGRFNFRNFKLPGTFVNAMKNFGSAAGRFFQRNVGKFFTVGRIGTAVSAGIGAVAGAGFGPIGSLAGAAGGGIGSFWIKSGDGARFLGKAANKGLNAFEKLSKPGLKGAPGSFASSGSKKLVWGLFLGLFFFVFFSGLIGGITNTTPSGQAAPAPGFIGTLAPPNPDCPKLHDEIYNKFKVDFDQQNPFSCDYLKWAWEKLWNISNTKFLDLVRGPDKNKIITVKREDKGFNEQTGCLSIIMSGISSAKGQPYPKSLFQVVFIHELTHIIQSCNPSTVNFTLLDAALKQEKGVSTFSQDPTKCISGVTQLNEDFAETLTYYLNPEWGEQSYFSSCQPQLSTNPILRGDKPLHRQFAAELLGSSVSLSTTSPQISCPVVGGGPNILPSFQANNVDGHCGTGYNQKLYDPKDQCQGNTRRGKSIDIDSCRIPRSWEKGDYSTCGANGKDVELPTIDGEKADWQYVDDFSLTRNDCFDHEIVDPNGPGEGCGIGYIFKTNLGGEKNWVLHLLHMGTTSLIKGNSYPSGTLVGKTQAIHTHISIGKDIQDIFSQDETGWKSVDTELKLCQ